MKFVEFLQECAGMTCEGDKCSVSLSDYKACDVDFSVYKKYKKYQQGLVKAWGGLLYLDFDGLSKSLKCAPIEDYRHQFEEYLDTKDKDDLSDFDDWLADMPPSVDNGSPLFDKDRIEADLLAIAKSTPSQDEIMIFRVNKDKNDWKKGWKSFTVNPKGYGAKPDNCVAFKIAKGCPLIFASELADKGEIVANLTHESFKKYVTELDIT